MEQAVSPVVVQASLWHSAWREMKASFALWWPWALSAGLIMGALALLANDPAMDPETLKAQPAVALAMLRARAPWLILSGIGRIIVQAIVIYAFTVIYMRRLLPGLAIIASVKNFFFYLWQGFLKYIRPVLWLLIPLLGVVFYIRSVTRREMLAPLVVLGQKPALKISWDMTLGQVWRILGNGIVLTLMIELIAIGVILPFAVALGVVLGLLHHHGVHEGATGSLVTQAVSTLAFSILMAVFLIANTVYCCTVYRVLSQEQKASGAAPVPVPPV